MRYRNNCPVMKFFLSCVLLVVSADLLIVGISEAFAKDFFVAASNGNDGNRGTKDDPFSSLKKGVSVLSPGDTLFVRNGTYLGSSSLSRIPNGNSWSAPVTIKAYPRENVVITAEPGLTVLQFKIGSHHIIVDGFILDAVGGHDGIRSGNDSHHIRILNSEIKNTPNQGIVTNTGSSNLEFINLRVHDNGTNEFDHGFYLSTGHHLVKNCEIYRNQGKGVQIFSQSGQAPSYNLIIGNLIHENGQSGRGAGIIVAGKGTTENRIINNVVWGEVGQGIVELDASNTKIYNNTVYACKRGGIIVDSRADFTTVINNIVYNNGPSNFVPNGTSIVHSNNLSTNPNFVDESKMDLHLQDGSSAIKAGATIADVTTDFDGKLRPTNANYDIGAFQSGNAQAPPSALRVVSR